MPAAERKIAVVTGSRAEYGLLYWLMREIQEDPAMALKLVVTGAHLATEHGMTSEVIEEDGFHIDARVEMPLSEDSPLAVAKSMGMATIGLADAFGRLDPDIIVLLGDRFEILAAAQAALVARIPVAHVHGGELTEGAFDDAIRHAVTKMAHLHFVAAKEYRDRVIQLGEQPERVFNVGAPGLDHLSRLALLDREAWQEQTGFTLGRQNFLVTYHPCTLGSIEPGEGIARLLAALDAFPEARIIFTGPNADPGGQLIARRIREYVSAQPGRTALYTNLGTLQYLSAVKHVDVVVGNSSSGLIEAPFLQTPTVNIGQRQHGRLKAASVIDCEDDSDAIADAIRRAMAEAAGPDTDTIVSPYGSGNASAQIKDILKGVPLEGLAQKTFYDLPRAPKA